MKRHRLLGAGSRARTHRRETGQYDPYLRTVSFTPTPTSAGAVEIARHVISLRELVELFHRITEYAQPVLESLKGEILSTPAI